MKREVTAFNWWVVMICLARSVLLKKALGVYLFTHYVYFKLFTRCRMIY